MKKNDFDHRLQNDLFPQMPLSFERKLAKALENEGVQSDKRPFADNIIQVRNESGRARSRKRPTAKGLFVGFVSVAAVAACLLIVVIGVLSGGKARTNPAAQTDGAPVAPAPTEAPEVWLGTTRIFTLSTGFEFTNEEKFISLYKGILRFLRAQGEGEPDELWLCAIASRYIRDDTGDRSDGYLSGYYVLAQHAFGTEDGAELYCLSEDMEVLWATTGSAPGPNHAVDVGEEGYEDILQRHLLYGASPIEAHVTRGALVGKEKGTDIEFSMRTWFPNVTERLEGSLHPDAAREYFLVTLSVGDWEGVLENPTLRFETKSGDTDVDLTGLPYAKLIFPLADPTPTAVPDSDTIRVLDLTDDWYGEEIVQLYGQAVARALRASGEHISEEGVWITGTIFDREHEDGTPPDAAYILVQYAFDGESSPELFYYENGHILWRTAGADAGRVNVVYHAGHTIAFGRSPAFDGEPLPMGYGKIVMADGGSDDVTPPLTLDEIQRRVPVGPNRYAARECFLWMDLAVHQVKRLTVVAMTGNVEREYTLDKVNVLEPQSIPAMAVESGGVVYPGMVTVFAQSLDEDGVTVEGKPLTEIVADGILFNGKKVWTRPLAILTASDSVSVDSVTVFSDDLMELYSDADPGVLDQLPPGVYCLCFHTTTLGPYSEAAGRYTFTTVYTIYKVTLQ